MDEEGQHFSIPPQLKFQFENTKNVTFYQC